jgi:hypothetical protein
VVELRRQAVRIELTRAQRQQVWVVTGKQASAAVGKENGDDEWIVLVFESRPDGDSTATRAEERRRTRS